MQESGRVGVAATAGRPVAGARQETETVAKAVGQQRQEGWWWRGRDGWSGYRRVIRKRNASVVSKRQQVVEEGLSCPRAGAGGVGSNSGEDGGRRSCSCYIIIEEVWRVNSGSSMEAGGGEAGVRWLERVSKGRQKEECL